MEQFFKKAFIIYIMIMNLLAFIAGVVFTFKGIDVTWLVCVPFVSIAILLLNRF